MDATEMAEMERLRRENEALKASKKPREKGPPKEPSRELTFREREVLEGIWNGGTNATIAEMLNVSVKTIEAHRARIFKKLEASNSVLAVRTALRRGILKHDLADAASVQQAIDVVKELAEVGT